MINRERYGYFDEIENIIFDPDEVWCVCLISPNFGKEHFNAYLKYYEDKPIVLLVNNDGRVDSMYKFDGEVGNFEKFRMGILKRKR